MLIYSMMYSLSYSWPRAGGGGARLEEAQLLQRRLELPVKRRNARAEVGRVSVVMATQVAGWLLAVRGGGCDVDATVRLWRIRLDAIDGAQVPKVTRGTQGARGAFTCLSVACDVDTML